MKVRDCVAFSRRVRTRSLAKRCRVLGEPDDSRIAILQFRADLEILTAFHLESGLHGSYVLRHPIRYRALRSDNRNPGGNRRTHVGGEICILRNFGSVSVAKEHVQAQSPFPAIERDSQRFILNYQRVFLNAIPECPSPASSPRKRGEVDTSRPVLMLTLRHLLCRTCCEGG
jgi:hypothetical protein